MASDFDDIFGDLKEDEQFSASLPGDFDDASIFGDAAPSTSSSKLDAVSKPPTDASATQSLPAPTAAATSSTLPATCNSEQDDDFLSWLDDGGGAPSEPPVSASDALGTMDDISLDPPSYNTSSSAVDAAPDTSATEVASPAVVSPIESMTQPPPPPPLSARTDAIAPAAIPIHVAGSSAPLDISEQTISLDDDDDDDDFLEKLVANANKKAAAASGGTGGSRESSGSSLSIKSQSSALQRAPALDFDAVCTSFVATGVLPPASRLAFWCHALGARDRTSAISMYALQTTPLDLPNQSTLRKDVESLCARIFASKLYRATIDATAAADDAATADGARLLFIDSAEILLTHACKRLTLDEYPLGLASMLAPLVTTGGNDPLQLELVATLLAVCDCALPHIAKRVAVRAVAAARRPLLKWLLLYHAPEIAFHLDQHFHTWHLAAPEPGSKTPQQQSTPQQQHDSGALLDSWVASMFECDTARDFDSLVKVWDCCVLVDSVGSSSSTRSAAASPMASRHASICMCFIVVHLIASRASKKLLRMEGEQLRHCMAQTLVDALDAVPNSAQLTLDVQQLIAATPPGFCNKLRAVGYEPPPPTAVPVESNAEPLAKRTSEKNLGMSLISASATGVKELSSAMIDMPTKLLALGLSSATSSSSAASKAATAASLKDDARIYEQLTGAGDSSFVAIRLAAADVIPSVFESFQASSPSSSSAANDHTVRYFIIDCRAASELRGGQVPTAFHFDPDAVTDPLVLERVLATLNPMKGKVHLCVMGHGYGHLVNEIRQQQQTQGSVATARQSPFAAQSDLFEAYAANLARVNSAVLFLTKQRFPYVSVLDGGYAAAHSALFHSTQFTVDDLVDHDAPNCLFCEHHRCIDAANGSDSITSTTGAGADATGKSDTSASTTASEPKQASFSHSAVTTTPSTTSTAAMATPTSKTASGQLDAKALFDTHGTGAGGSYFSSFTGALKTSGKTFMNPADSLKDSTKWLMKKTSSSGSGDMPAKPLSDSAASADAKTGSATLTAATASASASAKNSSGAMPNFNKLRNSLAAMGSESLDLLKKAEQAAVAKTRAPFGAAILSPSSKPPTASRTSSIGTSGGAAGSGSASSSTGAGGASSAAGANARAGGSDRNASFQKSEDEVFTIDDDDEEDDFVGGGGNSSRTSSSSSSARNESFSGHSGSAGPSSPAAVPAVHSVEKGHVGVLVKGMRVSRTQMLPSVESPFFSGYKKKKLAVGGGSSAPDRVSMLPRRLVIAENHLVVLKAERNLDDVYQVKSCHSLAHVARMTCLKKNALMVTVYYKWKTSNGDVVEKRNAYEVQQRDEFIKAIKGAMEKM